MGLEAYNVNVIGYRIDHYAALASAAANKTGAVVDDSSAASFPLDFFSIMA